MTYIKGFDIIRFVAFLLIIVYHFFPKFLAAGFLGVDMLLVLSGFLITRSIFTEVQKTGDFDSKNFFKKRFYRIFPTLLLAIIITLFFSLFSNPDFLVDIGKQVAATLGFVTNWYEILTGGSYEAQFIEHLFLHTWYLSIEIVFYVIWALFILFLVKSNQKRVKAQTNKRNLQLFLKLRNQILIVSFVLALIGYILMLIGIIRKENIATLYFSNFTRSYPLFIGSLLACLFHSDKRFIRLAASFKPKELRENVLRGSLIATFVVLFLAFLLSYESSLTYYFGILTASIATGVLIYYAILFHAATKIKSFPDLKSGIDRFTAYFNKISYPIYLFHWPLFVLAKQHFSPIISALISLFASILLANFASYIWEPAWQGKVQIPNLQFLNKKKYLFPGIAGIFAIILIITLFKAPWLTSMEETLMRNALMQSKDEANNLIVKAEVQELDEKERLFYEDIKGATIFGDSVMVGPRDYLLETIPDSSVDAAQYRKLDSVNELIQDLKESGDLKEFVILALGTNTSSNDVEFTEEIIADFPEKHRLIFITPYDGRGDSSLGSWQYREYLLTLEDKYDFVTVGDWFAVAEDNPQYYAGTDLVHFYGIPETYEAYSNFILETIERAKERSVK